MSSGWIPTRRGLLALGGTFLLCAICLFVLHRVTAPHYRLSVTAAVAAARANRGDREFLAHNPASSARVIPLDSKLQRVTFFNGGRVVLDAAVGERGQVVATEMHVPGVPASGAALANSPFVLGLLSVVFLLATAVMPLWRLRNLDALVLASLTITVPLINARLVGASVVCAVIALSYLMIRCMSVGLRAGGSAAAAPSTPLLGWLFGGWEPRQRSRMLRLIVLGAALAVAMITLTSSGYTDVAAASLEGATGLLHGVLPYGHIRLAVHGDTYPVLNYLLYIPGALWLPVRDVFSDLTGSLVTTEVAGLLVALALYRIAGSQEIAASKREPLGDRRLRAMLAWFAFPPALLAASGGSNDLLLAACLAWMLALRSRAGVSMLMLAMGMWVKLVPAILTAIWIPYGRRRDLTRSLIAAAALSLGLTGLLLALGGLGGVTGMLGALSFQFQRGSFFAPWHTFGLLWLQPLAQAGVFTLLLACVFHLRADRSVRRDPVRLSAIAAALLLGVQLAANYWTWSYLPWVFPFLLVALFMREGGPAVVSAADAHGSDSLRAGDLRLGLRERAPAVRSPTGARAQPTPTV
jgi:hypothetical protein